MSTTFFPGAQHSTAPSDLIIISADRVLFHLHANQVLALSTNGFAHKWPPQSCSVNSNSVPIILVPEPSPLVNLVLHCVYDLPCTRFSSSVEDVSDCVTTIIKYGLPLAVYISQGRALYNLVLSKAPTAGIQMYALAAQHRLEQLAVALSPFLLSYDLATLTDDLVGQMGAVYLRRLVFLHLGRSAALKRLLSPPLNYHTPDDTCGTREHDALMNAWSLAVTPLAWNARPGPCPPLHTSSKYGGVLNPPTDLAPTTVKAALGPLVDLISCSRCKEGIQRTIKSVVATWVGIKVSLQPPQRPRVPNNHFFRPRYNGSYGS